MAEATTTRSPRAMNETEWLTYKPLFGPAVASLGLGLLSILALVPMPPLFGVKFLPWFGILPAATLLVGTVALIKLRWRGDEASGARLARVGMTLAVTFGVGGAVNTYLPDEFLLRRARDAASRWLTSLAEGKVEEAVFLMLPAGDRPPPQSSWEMLKRFNRNLLNMYNELNQRPEARRLGELGNRCRIMYETLDDYEYVNGQPHAYLVYRVTIPARGGSRESSYFFVLMQMVADRHPRTRSLEWRIQSCQAPYQLKTARIPRQAPGHSHGVGEEHPH